MTQPIPAAVEERFWTNVDAWGPSSCWEWVGRTDQHGYGAFRYKQNGKARYFLAHRLAYELLVAPIPSGLVSDHLCRNRTCVNPDHIEPVTDAENRRRGNLGKVLRRRIVNGHRVCGNGHVLTPCNTRPHHAYPHLLVCCDCQRAARARHQKRRTA